MPDQEFREHIQSLEAIEAVHVANLKAEGASCDSCTYCLKRKYFLFCKMKKKLIKSYNICHHYSK